jgi:hypothetical protein
MLPMNLVYKSVRVLCKLYEVGLYTCAKGVRFAW